MESTTLTQIRDKKAELEKLSKLKETFLSVMDGSSNTDTVITEIETKMTALTAEIDTLVESCPTVQSDSIEVNQYNLPQFQTLAKRNFVVDGITPTSITITAKYF